jgi:hypothetical protein
MQKQLGFNDLLYLLQDTTMVDTRRIIDLRKDNRQFRIISDLHGSASSLLDIIDQVGRPSFHNPYIVVGDILDKGSFAPELLVLLCMFKKEDRNSIYITKGNHEQEERLNTEEADGTYPQLLQRNYSKNVANLIYNLIRIHCVRFPLCVLLPDTMVVHAMCPIEENQRLDNITHSLERFMLWSDVHKGKGKKPNTNRRSESIEECCSVGLETIFQSMSRQKINYLIRGHQYCSRAIVQMNKLQKVITIASSPYRDPSSDMASFVSLSPDLLQIHNIAPDKTMSTFQYRDHYLIAKLSSLSVEEHLRSMSGVVEVFQIQSNNLNFYVKVDSIYLKKFLLNTKKLLLTKDASITFEAYQ